MINPADISTIRVGQLAQALPNLTDKIPHEIETDLFQCTIQDLVDLFNLNVGTLQYEVKTLYVNQEYIDTNFDSTGLGRLLCDGFAIVNGNNGTPPAGGMFELSYKDGVYPIGAYGGSKDSVVVEHNHSFSSSAAGDAGGGVIATGNSTEGAGTFGLQQTGVSGLDKNMPPYIVALKIMKL